MFLGLFLDKRLTVMISLAVGERAHLPTVARSVLVPWQRISVGLGDFLTYETFAACVAPVRHASTDSMLADVGDEHELDTGIRREGVIYAVRAFSTKATAAFGTLLGGLLLSAIDFPEKVGRGELSPETTWNLGFVMGPGTSIFSILEILFYLGYRINKRRHGEIMAALEKRRGGKSALSRVSSAD